MSDLEFGFLKGNERGNWVRLRTIILLRWGAVTGQVIALFVAQQAYNIQIEMALCLLVVGVAVMGNLIAMFIFPENKRLSETENLLMVLFDLLQLALLLYLTGGITNPFALLIGVPPAVALRAGRFAARARYLRFRQLACDHHRHYFSQRLFPQGHA